jgi:hypothetical protein
MYHHQAMMERDTKDFKEAMAKEISNQMENRNFTIHKKVDIPKGKTILLLYGKWERKRTSKLAKSRNGKPD